MSDSQTEKLELRNLVALAESAREKIKNKKPLTKREIAAVAELERRQAPPLVVDAQKAALLIALPESVTDEAIHDLFGDITLCSLTDVAGAFGVSVATVRHTWRPNGMPGEGKRGSGSKINLGGVVAWLRNRNASNESARGKNEHTERKRDAETRAAEAEARIKERKAEVSEGQYTPTAVAVSVVRGCANWFRDGLMGVARKLEPIFPARDAKKYVAEVEREHRNLLVAFEETAINDLRAAADKAYEQ